MLRVWLMLVWLLWATGAQAALLAASAANFADTLKALARLYGQQGGEPVKVVVGSSGKLYAQIRHGAPFDLFFSADMARPSRLHQAGLATLPVPYALGELALWSPRGDRPPKARLLSGAFRRLALANPKTAPYGLAAVETLKALALWPMLRNRVVRGENVGQAFSLVRSGAADLGFVARAQLVRIGQDDDTHRWRVPPTLHGPVEQGAVVIVRSPHRARARAFLDFVRYDPAARRLIEKHGYRLP